MAENRENTVDQFENRSVELSIENRNAEGTNTQNLAASDPHQKLEIFLVGTAAVSQLKKRYNESRGIVMENMDDKTMVINKKTLKFSWKNASLLFHVRKSQYGHVITKYRGPANRQGSSSRQI